MKSKIISELKKGLRFPESRGVEVAAKKDTDDIDREIDLIDRLQIRIEDIIRFVGIGYGLNEKSRDLWILTITSHIIRYRMHISL
jgi:hypothetical protein